VNLLQLHCHDLSWICRPRCRSRPAHLPWSLVLRHCMLLIQMISRLWGRVRLMMWPDCLRHFLLSRHLLWRPHLVALDLVRSRSDLLHCLRILRCHCQLLVHRWTPLRQVLHLVHHRLMRALTCRMQLSNRRSYFLA
jgi:hypothetical protein